MLFHSMDTLPRGLDDIKLQLRLVTGDSVSKKDKAEAAIKLGRHLQSYQAGHARRAFAVSQAAKWFDFALTHCESVVGARELAAEILSTDDMLVVAQNLDVELLPSFVGRDDNAPPGNYAVSSRVSDTWKKGMQLGLNGATTYFLDWDEESVLAAIACTVNFLIFKPKTIQKLRGHKAQPINLDILQWAVPTWDRLIDALSNRNLARQLQAQQRAVLMVVKDPGEIDGLDQMQLVDDCGTSDDDSVVVIKGVIASSPDREDAAHLDQYNVLRKPVKLMSLPSLDELMDIRRTLQAEFPWAKDAIAITMSEIFARKIHGSKRLGMQPILLAGLPGTGKTRFAQRLAELLGAPSTVINMSGMTDVKVLKGVTRGWSSNRPSRIVEFMKQSRAANPLFILDEVDKAHGYGNGGNPQDALLDLLEAGNAKHYSDIYLMTECDVSHALYILTANSLERLSEPLKSRLRIVFFPAPGPEHTSVIVEGVLYDLEKRWNVPAGTLSLVPAELRLLVGLSPREIKRAILEITSQVNDRNRNMLH
jgi:hypothetical protein